MDYDDSKDGQHHPQVQKIDEIELFRTFKKYDRNMNGTLELPEYTQCLAEAPDMELTKQEIITLALSADLDGDGKIDFEEFMKHYATTLDMIFFQNHMNHGYRENM